MFSLNTLFTYDEPSTAAAFVIFGINGNTFNRMSRAHVMIILRTVQSIYKNSPIIAARSDKVSIMID